MQDENVLNDMVDGGQHYVKFVRLAVSKKIAEWKKNTVKICWLKLPTLLMLSVKLKFLVLVNNKWKLKSEAKAKKERVKYHTVNYVKLSDTMKRNSIMETSGRLTCTERKRTKVRHTERCSYHHVLLFWSRVICLSTFRQV